MANSAIWRNRKSLATGGSYGAVAEAAANGESKPKENVNANGVTGVKNGEERPYQPMA
jgi:hypothetical protein